MRLREHRSPPHGLRQRVSHRPTAVEPAENGSLRHAELLCPFRDAKRLPGMVDDPVAASVPSALLLSGPSAVTRRVPAVVVDPIQDRSSRTWLHIHAEGLVSLPPRMDGNAAPAVPMEQLVVWVRAPLMHRAPHVVERRAGLAVSLWRVSTKAPAGLKPLLERGARSDNGLPALASAPPSRSRADLSCAFHDFKASVLPPDHICDWHAHGSSVP